MSTTQQILYIRLGLSSPLPEVGSHLGHWSITTGRFLHILELHLGICPQLASQVDRIVAYQQAIAAANEPCFQDSFSVDPLGVAQSLLSWRDALYLAGWQGANLSGSARLAALAKVECHAKHIAPNEAQRLSAIQCAIHAGAKLPITHIHLMEPLACFPKVWRDVLDNFYCTEERYAPQGKTGTLLRSVQEALLAGFAGKVHTVHPLEDESIQVFQSETHMLGAQLLTALRQKANPSCLLVLPAHTRQLETILASRGLPSQGLSELSTFRPALQVLPLAFALLWAPLDAYALLEFLTHPVCPLPDKLRYRLAEAFAAKPGLLGENITAVWSNTCQGYGDDGDRIQKESMDFLLSDRYSHADGIPLSVALARVQYLQAWFQKGLERKETRTSFAAAWQQCADVAAGFIRMGQDGKTTVSPRDLQQLLQLSTAQGCTTPAVIEIGVLPAIDHPASAAGAFMEVIWWPMATQPSVIQMPWSKTEYAALSHAGIDWPNAESQLQWQAMTWLRPVLAAQERMSLILPPPGEEVHPLWLMIKSLIEPVLNKHPIQSAESLILRGKMPAEQHVQLRPLPEPRRWWDLEAGLLRGMRQIESYSSLSLLLSAPYQWILKYQARLSSGRLQQMPNAAALNGTLSHTMAEMLFLKPGCRVPDFAPNSFQSWFEPTFERLLHHEGCLLLMRGKRQERELLRSKLLNAFPQLLTGMRDRQVEAIFPEKALCGSLGSSKLIGYADLFMECRKGEKLVVDMKWGGQKKYGDALRSNKALQLAIYSELCHQETGCWAQTAYFILSSGQWLNRPEDAENNAQIWQRFLRSWEWRQEQIKQGRIEVPAPCTEDDPNSEPPPEDGLRWDAPNEDYNEFSYLCGWEAGA